MVIAWEKFKQTQAKAKDSITKVTSMPLDLNTADSISLVRLKGIGPVTVSKIITYRRKQPFTDLYQLKELGHFSKATFDTLKMQLIIHK
ncbi:MAG: Helix-hairpin-helix motif [Flavipsychrobacter sp.]|nr:Helix-hairpin-helix motif [Flavipsychrobacter sp.]